ncbi:hypothetical protein [Pseudomonas sp. NBRC 111139]|uniref:hypothetical protein n=1 Tax=Pseudomonas sp. NBRC 111139 TaxID=1661054 RepID=UPI001112E429|nr:hypothetical protein [Pseudomonas sp. NBRC 111139]
MNQSIIDSWIERLGHPHASLVTLSHLPDIPLEVVFMGQESETATPLPGLELEFSTEPLILKCVHVNVIRTIPQDQPYQGTLPDRLQGLTTRKEVTERFGPSSMSQPPLQMPSPLGDTGGWDVFAWENTNNVPTFVMVQYNTDLQVCDLAFFREGI